MIFHVLNGDALKERFPTVLIGNQLVLRECLIEGPVESASMDEFYKERSTFLNDNYQTSFDEYKLKSRAEIEQLTDIPGNSSVYLWFEDDLFCQVHLWFSCFLIKNFSEDVDCYLVRPNTSLRFGFGGMDNDALVNAFENKSKLSDTDLEMFAKLWQLYQEQNFDGMSSIGNELKNRWPFLLPAIEAHQARFPGDGSLPLPEKILIKHMNAMPGADFPSLFSVASEDLAIYGFGDIQVKRIYENINRR